MGEANDCHFSGHHRIGRIGDLFHRLQQHLPAPGQSAHRQGLCHLATAVSFVGTDGGIVRGIGRDLGNGDPMGDLGQIAQHCEGIGPIGILAGKFFQRGAGIAAHDHVKEIQHSAAIGEPQHGPHIFGGDRVACGLAQRLVQ